MVIFKVGDFVEITQSIPCDYGKQGKILSIYNEYGYFNIEGIRHPYMNDQIKLVESKEVSLSELEIW